MFGTIFRGKANVNGFAKMQQPEDIAALNDLNNLFDWLLACVLTIELVHSEDMIADRFGSTVGVPS